MRKFALGVVLLSLVFGCNRFTSSSVDAGPDDEVAVVDTDYGRFVIEFYPEKAPHHVAHFKKLAREGFFDGLAFHRVIPNQIIQGGDPNTRNGPPETWGQGQPGQPTIDAEFTDLKHVRGAVSAARRGGDINSATSQFFVCSTAKPEWDGQYSVFGHVIQGMNVVDIISQAPRDEKTERPVERAGIKSVKLVKKGSL